MSTPTTTFTQTVTPIDLQVTGMTCASCAMRIEKKLNKVPGVVARGVTDGTSPDWPGDTLGGYCGRIDQEDP